MVNILAQILNMYFPLVLILSLFSYEKKNRKNVEISFLFLFVLHAFSMIYFSTKSVVYNSSTLINNFLMLFELGRPESYFLALRIVFSLFWGGIIIGAVKEIRSSRLNIIFLISSYFFFNLIFFSTNVLTVVFLYSIVATTYFSIHAAFLKDFKSSVFAHWLGIMILFSISLFSRLTDIFVEPLLDLLKIPLIFIGIFFTIYPLMQFSLAYGQKTLVMTISLMMAVFLKLMALINPFAFPSDNSLYQICAFLLCLYLLSISRSESQRSNTSTAMILAYFSTFVLALSFWGLFNIAVYINFALAGFLVVLYILKLQQSDKDQKSLPIIDLTLTCLWIVPFSIPFMIYKRIIEVNTTYLGMTLIGVHFLVSFFIGLSCLKDLPKRLKTVKLVFRDIPHLVPILIFIIISLSNLLELVIGD